MVGIESLFSRWSLKGQWWRADDPRPEHETDYVAGELSFIGQESGLILDLLGQFSPVIDQWMPTPFDAHDPIGTAGDIISDDDSDETTQTDEAQESVDQHQNRIKGWVHGRSVCGKAITLVDVTDSSGSFSYDSVLAVQTQFKVRMAILNSHLSPNSLYKRITLSFPGLTNFFLTGPVFKVGLENTDEIVRIAIAPKELSVETIFDDKPIRVELWRRAYSQHNFRTKLKVKTQTAFTIECESEQSLDWWISLAYSLQYFLSIAYGFPTCPSRFFLDLSDDQQCSVWYGFGRSQLKEDVTAKEMIVSASLFGEGSIVGAIDAWFRLPKEVESVAHQFFGNFFFPHSKARVDFVFYSQTLEIFHGVMHPSAQLLSESEKALFKLLKKFMRKYISKTSPRLNQELNNRLAKTGYPSQKERLKQLFSILNEYCPRTFYEDPSDFATCIVDTRNFYIHGSMPEKDTFLNVLEQTAAVEGLKLAILLLFLRQLNLPADRVRRGILSNIAYRNWRSLQPRFLSNDALKKKVQTKRR